MTHPANCIGLRSQATGSLNTPLAITQAASLEKSAAWMRCITSVGVRHTNSLTSPSVLCGTTASGTHKLNTNSVSSCQPSVSVRAVVMRPARWMCCAKLGVSIKDFVNKAVIASVDQCEDAWMLERWEKDGTRAQIERERNDPNHVVYECVYENEEHKFIEKKWSDIIAEQMDLSANVI